MADRSRQLANQEGDRADHDPHAFSPAEQDSARDAAQVASDDRPVRRDAPVYARRRKDSRDSGAEGGLTAEEMEARRCDPGELREVRSAMKLARASLRVASAACILAILAAPGCSPDRALDFGPTGEITTPPPDALSRQILKEFDGRDFTLGHDDREAAVSLSDWPNGRRVIIPF